jgi:RHS repeat-associated protein
VKAAEGLAAGETFTWEPAIPSSGVYTVYARWPASSLNSSAASYSIVHAGGTATVVANQRLNGGSWKYLGSFEFAANAGHKVILQASADGDTIADAVRLVGSAPAPANVLYVHSDHLGTPQKMTDATKVVTWDRVQDPFGNTHSLAGTAQNPLRFPGQYADEESSLSYNYFRDYDPTLGRYVQSDPIGLIAGPNTYAYAGSRPISVLDPLGLAGVPSPYLLGGCVCDDIKVFHDDEEFGTAGVVKFILSGGTDNSGTEAYGHHWIETGVVSLGVV